MKDKIYISDLHFENKLWLSELSFQKDELKTFQHRLEEVAPRWTDLSVRSQIEQYQNQFIRQNEVLDIMIHDLNKEETDLANQAKGNPVAIDHVHFKDHVESRDRVETQKNIYRELKGEFLRFLTKTM